MKAGLKVGDSAEAELIVTNEMNVAFEGQIVHELYSTSVLTHHMEWVSRKVIVDYLEDNEEAVGYHVDIYHLKPTLGGMKVRLKAAVSQINGNKIVTDVEAFNDLGKIARGHVTQALVGKAWLEQKRKEMSLIHGLSKEVQSAAVTK
jgi:predicted thioesterase